MRHILNACLFMCFAAPSFAAPDSSFTSDTTVTTPRGTASQHVEHTATANGYTHDIERTNGKGETATRHVEVERDPVTGTRSRTVEGTTFKGKEYSSETLQQRTDDGYIKQREMTTPNGKTRSKTVEVTRTATSKVREVTRVNAQGEVRHSIKTKTLTRSR